MKKIVKKGMSSGKKVAIGAGVAAIGAASAGAYYLFGPNKKAHQKKAKALMAKMKKEAISELKKAKKLSVPMYHKAVDVVSKNYAKQYKAHAKDINAIAQKLKGELKDVEKLAKSTAKKAVKVAKKKRA